MKQLTKTIKDYKDYLDQIERLSKPLNDLQKDKLNQILESQLILLVALKQNSNLGGYTFER